MSSETAPQLGPGLWPGPSGTDPNLGSRQQVAVTSHTLVTAQGPLPYTATAGYFSLTEERIGGELAQEPVTTAQVFLTAYQAEVDSAARRRRPVIFIFNGGPGSSSVWLHLGLFGPRLAQAVAGTTALPPPYQLVDNPDSPLSHSDLVLVDPVSTGYSRVVAGEVGDRFHGVDADVESVAELIRLWVTRHGRWGSPIFIAGESYGVLRSTKIADYLARRHGLYLSGLILISSTLGGASMTFGPGHFLSTVAFLPTYTAVAHYHGFHPGKTLAEVVGEAEAYASGDLLRALALGHNLPAAERDQAVATVARLTGLAPDYVAASNLRLPKHRFTAELLRQRGLVVGEIDGRFTGWNPDGVGEWAEADPTTQVLTGAYAGAINDYLRNELGYANDLSYEIISERVRPWKPARDPLIGFDSVGALSRALRTNRHLKVLYHVGYYDVCTPYWGAITDLAQLEVPVSQLAHIEVTYFESGHMIYIDEPSRIAQSRDIERFVQAAIQPATVNRKP